MVRQPSRIHHTNKRNPLTKAVMPKSDSPARKRGKLLWSLLPTRQAKNKWGCADTLAIITSRLPPSRGGG